uniref:Motile sperm domain-containing protein 1 n=1 Tax=Elaeophora elaphi TaxID=1147741 RepID=A0A0R3RW38_9BILA
MIDDKGSLFAFVFPNELEIIISDPQTHKQILTLYNPYHFPIKFKVKCTNAHSFSVIEPHGILRASSSVDIIIRHVAVKSQTSIGLEKFRIEIFSLHNHKISGSVDVVVHIVETASKFSQSRYHQLVPTTSTDHSSVRDSTNSTQSSSFFRKRFDVTSPLIMVCVVAVAVCAVALMLPTEGLDVSAVVPNWLHLSVHLKLVFAYILGLVTLVLLRPG